MQGSDQTGKGSLERHDSIFDASPTLVATGPGLLGDDFDPFGSSAGPSSNGGGDATEQVYSTVDKSAKRRISAADMTPITENDDWDAFA